MQLLEFRMPKFEETADTAIVIEWLKKEGEPVSKGESLLEVETEKFTHPIPSPADAILEKILIEEGVDAEVGTILALLRVPGN